MYLKMLVLLARTTKNIYLKFNVYNLFNFDTGLFSRFGHVTCPANFKRADYCSGMIGLLSAGEKLTGCVVTN